MGRYKRLGQRLGHSRGFASFAKRVAPPIDKFLHKVTGGRLTFAGTVLPTLVLVHTGRRSGKRVRTPLSYVDTGDAFVLAATNFGQAHHPAWSYNLMANPEATIEVRGRKIPVRARRVDDSEKAQLWPHFVDIWPAYDTYVERSQRDIRVFVLERRTA